MPKIGKGKEKTGNLLPEQKIIVEKNTNIHIST